jgi:hypothetical protein
MDVELTKEQVASYTGLELPEFSGLADHKFVKKIVERAYLVVNNPRYFIPKLVNLIRLTMDASNDDYLPVDDSVLVQHAIKMMNEYKAPVVALAEQNHNLAEYHSKIKEICLNSAWVTNATRLVEGTREYDLQFALIVVKYIHELGHSFTPYILKLDKELRNAKGTKRNTPQKVGTQRIRKARGPGFEWRGDMGFALEELVFGFRLYPFFSPHKSYNFSYVFGVRFLKNEEDDRGVFQRRGLTKKALNRLVKILAQIKSSAVDPRLLFLNDADVEDYHPPITIISVSSKKRKLAPYQDADQEELEEDNHAICSLGEEFYDIIDDGDWKV